MLTMIKIVYNDYHRCDDDKSECYCHVLLGFITLISVLLVYLPAPSQGVVDGLRVLG